jgi:hypothetical protein
MIAQRERLRASRQTADRLEWPSGFVVPMSERLLDVNRLHQFRDVRVLFNVAPHMRLTPVRVARISENRDKDTTREE